MNLRKIFGYLQLGLGIFLSIGIIFSFYIFFDVFNLKDIANGTNSIVYQLNNQVSNQVTQKTGFILPEVFTPELVAIILFVNPILLETILFILAYILILEGILNIKENK